MTKNCLSPGRAPLKKILKNAFIFLFIYRQFLFLFIYRQFLFLFILRQFLANERPLKMMKNAFHFT